VDIAQFESRIEWFSVCDPGNGNFCYDSWDGNIRDGQRF
jgi:hypothetical protein